MPQPFPRGPSAARSLTAVTALAVCAALLGAGLPQLAQAQYLWIDDKGVKQFSDRPPPPSVPAKRILKAPGKPRFDPYETAADDAAAEPASPASPPGQPSTAAQALAARDADFNKRKAEAEAAGRKAAAEARQKADQAANCEAARQNQMALDQGLRMSNFDKNGEQGFLSDQERLELAQKNRSVLAGCK